MKCDKCDKPAKVHLTQLVGGKVKKIALCNECAAEGGVTDPTGFALADMLLGPTGGMPTKDLTAEPTVIAEPGQSCPSCGFTLEDLKKVRRFGCGDCYTAFRDEVKHMVRGMHKGAMHQGKVPDGMMEIRQRKLRLEELKGKLNEAIRAENYEDAASFRDEILKIETELERQEASK